MNKDQKLTWDDIKRMFAETDRQFKEIGQRMKQTDQQMKQTDQRLDKRFAESVRQTKALEELLKEANEKLDKRFVKMAEEIERANSRVGGIGNSNGDMAEEYFFSAFRKDKIFMNEQYDRIQKGFFYSFECPIGEFDIVLFNGKSVAIIEVKYKATPYNIDIDDLISRIERFKKYVPEYKNHNIYLGVAAMSFKSGLASKLHKKGIATIHPVGKRMMIYDKTVKTF